MNVFKPKRKENSRTVTRQYYSGRFRVSGDLKPTTVALHTRDKEIALRKLQQIVLEREKENLGMIPAASTRAALACPLVDHLKDFIREREQAGRTWRNIGEPHRKLHRVFSEIGWKMVSDLTADSFRQWRSKKDCSAKTLKEYQIAVTSFANWLKKTRRGLTENPFDVLESVKVTGKETFKRRALAPTEIAALLDTAGVHRPVYLLALFAGLRRNELKQGEWHDLDLEIESPVIRVRGSTTKNGKDEVLPLHPQSGRNPAPSARHTATQRGTTRISRSLSETRELQGRSEACQDHERGSSWLQGGLPFAPSHVLHNAERRGCLASCGTTTHASQ